MVERSSPNACRGDSRIFGGRQRVQVYRWPRLGFCSLTADYGGFRVVAKNRHTGQRAGTAVGGEPIRGRCSQGQLSRPVETLPALDTLQVDRSLGIEL